jgi:hypothetical protein
MERTREREGERGERENSRRESKVKVSNGRDGKQTKGASVQVDSFS